MFTDNDDLAGMVASMMGAEALILLTNVNGLYDKSPIVPDAKLIPEVTKQTDVVNYVTKERSQFGRGGMMTKVGVGRKMAKLGIATYIVNGNTENILIDLLINQQPRGTYFPVEQQVSQVKKWVAYGQGMHKGEVIINQGAVDVLLSPEKVASLLPVGVVKVVGDFQKGDLIKIKDEHGDDIGLGMAQYDADQAREVIGQSGMKPLIHYDYLYLE
jgi:glutamate 5-kinase